MKRICLLALTALVVSTLPLIKRPFTDGFLKASDLSDNALLTVGVLTMPSFYDRGDEMTANQYVTQMVQVWMISGGLNPVFIPYNATDEDLYHILGQVNGVFFTGGDLNLWNPETGLPHPYSVTAQKILDYAIKTTDGGDYFPIMGVCQGHELLHILVANDTRILGYSNAENVNLNTDFTVKAAESKMLKTFSPDML